MLSSLSELNDAPADDALKALMACVGSRTWAERLLQRRPFQSIDSLEEDALECSQGLADTDWLEAVASHPRIGERRGHAGGRHTGWSDQEQAGARDAQTETMVALREANIAYEQRFGYTFIVCATGKTGEEMLAICHERLANDAAMELQVAANELRRIAEIRLRRLTGGKAE